MPTEHDTSAGWNFADGWILASAAAYGSDRSVSLKELISAADGMNRAIPTPEECNGSFARLCAAGVVEGTADGFRVRAEHAASLDAAMRGRGGLFEGPKKALRWLSRIAYPTEPADAVTVTDQEFEAAYKCYRASARSRP